MTSTRLATGDAFEGIQAARNYLRGSSFELGVIQGWSTYADAAGTTPVDGTGGSPTVTFTAQSGFLIRNQFSGRLTKDAANRQGQGASYDFTIDAADTGRPLSIAFDFLASAAYVAGDVDVFIYDVTNSTLITPSSIDVAAGKGTFRAFFVATTSTSYRLILHVATTNASAWTLDTDNFQVGPQVQLSGAAVTDPVAFTPTTTQGFGTLASNLLTYQQVGNRMVISGRFTAGTVDGNNAQIGLPAGFSIGSQAGSSGDMVRGHWWVSGGAVSNRKRGTLWGASGGTVLHFGNDDYTTAGSPNSFITGTSVGASGAVIWVEASLPIANWSSNVTMAERAVEEYASNSSSTNSTDTSSFVNGIAGSQGIFGITALTGDVAKRVRFQTPIQPTDNLFVEIFDSVTKTWSPLGANRKGVPAYFQQGTLSAGILLSGVNSTDVDVIFGRYWYFNSATYAAAGVEWSNASIADSRWRVRKVSGGAAVGYPISCRNLVGDTSGTTVPAGMLGEQVTASLSDVPLLTSSIPANAGSISLGSGTWMVFYKGCVDYNSAATFTDARTSISTSSAVQHGPSQVGDGSTNVTAARLLGTSVRYLSVASTQTVFAVIQASFTTGVSVRSSASSSQFFAVRIA